MANLHSWFSEIQRVVLKDVGVLNPGKVLEADSVQTLLQSASPTFTLPQTLLRTNTHGSNSTDCEVSDVL